MKIAVAYSSKTGLLKEYEKHYQKTTDIPPDFFAEGDSVDTINSVLDAIRSGGHEVFSVEADDTAPATLENLRPELVFNIAEGLFGDFRESYIPLVCERLGLPYTGSDPLTLAICLNKARTKEILNYHSIPTPPFRVLHPLQKIELNDFYFPAIVKPIAEGSSKGIFNDSVVEDPKQARKKIEEILARYNEPVMIEKFLEKDEYTVAIWGNGKEVDVLPIVAISYDDLPEGARPIYSYEAKWIWDTPDKPLEIFKCPAPLTYLQQRNIEDVVRDTYRVMHIRDWCRIDIRMDDQGVAHILELNPLPGILPNPEDNSCFPKAARTKGYSYTAMINKVIEFARKRYGI
ncbi:MAG: D-alanine--D-alanine ligase family protein [Candidatus Zhuqueibacterota bacterium]